MQGNSNDNQAVQEQVRQDYLEAMGIQPWFPRCQLPNALPPRPFDWISEDVEAWQNEQGTPTPSTPSSEEVGPAANGYRRLRVSDILSQAHIEDDSKSTPADNKKPEPEEKKVKPRRGAPATSKFRLVVQAVSDECLIVAEMPHSGLNQFTRFHQNLLNDILRALKLTVDLPPSIREFVWPISENRGLMSQLDQDDSAAADAVCAFLSNQFGLTHHKIVILLGQAAARFVIEPDKNFDELRGIQKGMHPKQIFAVSHGLNELMKLPQLKAEAWQDLAPALKIHTPEKSISE